MGVFLLGGERVAGYLNHERAAAILVDAAYLGDDAAAKKWKITTRTIINYRALLRTNPSFSQIFQRKRQAAEGNWVSGLRRTLGAVMETSRAIVESIEPTVQYVDPDTGLQEQRANLEALPLLLQAGKDLGEIALALEVLNAGDPDQNADLPAQGQGVAQGKPLPN